MRIADLPKEFEIIKINKYLEKYLKADPIFYYSKEENRINLSIDWLDWGDFFHDKETMWILFLISRNKKKEKKMVMAVFDFDFFFVARVLFLIFIKR